MIHYYSSLSENVGILKKLEKEVHSTFLSFYTFYFGAKPDNQNGDDGPMREKG